jgi:hypothetical protein
MAGYVIFDIGPSDPGAMRPYIEKAMKNSQGNW